MIYHLLEVVLTQFFLIHLLKHLRQPILEVGNAIKCWLRLQWTYSSYLPKFHQWRDLIAIGVSNMQNDLNKVGYKFVCQDKQLNFMGTMLQDDGKFWALICSPLGLFVYDGMWSVPSLSCFVTWITRKLLETTRFPLWSINFQKFEHAALLRWRWLVFSVGCMPLDIWGREKSRFKWVQDESCRTKGTSNEETKTSKQSWSMQYLRYFRERPWCSDRTVKVQKQNATNKETNQSKRKKEREIPLWILFLQQKGTSAELGVQKLRRWHWGQLSNSLLCFPQNIKSSVANSLELPLPCWLFAAKELQELASIPGKKVVWQASQSSGWWDEQNVSKMIQNWCWKLANCGMCWWNNAV